MCACEGVGVASRVKCVHKCLRLKSDGFRMSGLIGVSVVELGKGDRCSGAF